MSRNPGAMTSPSAVLYLTQLSHAPGEPLPADGGTHVGRW